MTGTRTAAVLAVSLLAGGLLILGGPGSPPPPPPPPPAPAWVDMDGTSFTPLLYLDARTAVGVSPVDGAREQQLVVRSASGIRELRRVPLDGNPQFTALTATEDRILWAETSDRSARMRIWAAGRSGGAPSELTSATGNALFFGTSYDLVVADGRVHWAAASGDARTEIRSVPLTGGVTDVRSVPGAWALTAWPWLISEDGTRLRAMSTPATVAVSSPPGADSLTCTPTWCREVVPGPPSRIEVFHPDGSSRREVATGATQSAVPDVAVLDRFEILSVPGPGSDLTGKAALVIHDLSTSRTIDVAADASSVQTRDGILWWSTTTETPTWHSLDLRTL